MYERQLRAYGKRYVRSCVHHTAPSSLSSLSSLSPFRPYNNKTKPKTLSLCELCYADCCCCCRMPNVECWMFCCRRRRLRFHVCAILAYISDAAFWFHSRRSLSAIALTLSIASRTQMPSADCDYVSMYKYRRDEYTLYIHRSCADVNK